MDLIDRSSAAVLSAILACCVVKNASKLAFRAKDRTMSSVDILNFLGESFRWMATKS